MLILRYLDRTVYCRNIKNSIKQVALNRAKAVINAATKDVDISKASHAQIKKIYSVENFLLFLNYLRRLCYRDLTMFLNVSCYAV